jgi:hypothetical protein
VFSSQLAPPVNGFRLYGSRNSLEEDNVHHTVIQHRSRGYKSYVNYVVPSIHTAREYLRSARKNVGRFLRNEFHDDAGMKTLVEAFYRAVRDETRLPIPYSEILRTSRIMDDIFAQLAQNNRAPGPGEVREAAQVGGLP